MEDTRSHKQIDGALTGEARRQFMRALLTDLRALERLLADGRFERGVTRIGAEQEVFLVDHACHPAPVALDVLGRVGDPHFTTELGLFQLEMNADPQLLSGGGLRAMEAQLAGLLDKTRAVCAQLDVQPAMVGILPTIGKTDLALRNMVPNPRYMTLNRVMNAERGAAYDLSIKGIDELNVQHDSLMVEACNASFQVHLQLDAPERFAHFYNVAQLLVAPTLAMGTNSPVLFGRRLWAETRIALFEQACDIRTPGYHLRDRAARVLFGKGWLRGSVLDLFKENIIRFRPLVGTDLGDSALDALNRGEIPELKALRLHNGTIYRWNRPCYGISESGKPHLRIELRVLPSGPTIADEVANAAFWLGLMVEVGNTLEDVPARMEFDHAQANLYAAARDGLSARFTWLDGEEVLAQPLILDRLLPMARAGLDRAGTDPADASRYLGIIEQRVRTLRTGSRWMLTSLASMKDRGGAGERLTALTSAILARQKTQRVVSEWERASLDEVSGDKSSYHRVAQYMTTDIFTVQADDPVELVADMISWRRIRHVPVEDARGQLVGLITYRAVMRQLAERAKGAGVGTRDPRGTSVTEIMKTQVITVSPDTTTLQAVALMRQHRVGCLPVVQDGHLVGMLTEEDFMGIASDLFRQGLAETK